MADAERKTPPPQRSDKAPHAERRVRPATPADVPLIVQLIRDLAEYEREPDAAVATEAMIHASLFGDAFGSVQAGNTTVNGVPRHGPVAECLIGEIANEGVPDGWSAQGFALFFMNYSTWLGKPGVYLEDLFVRPGARGVGLGKALFIEVARVAVHRGCTRLEWNVLDWNTPAIEFYKGLGAGGLDEWTIHRLAGNALGRLGAAKQ